MKRFYLQPRKMDNDFGALFSNFFNHSHYPSCVNENESLKSFNPKVNIVEHDDNISLTFELPGMEKSDIKVLVKDNMLTVSGERKMESEVKEDGYIRTEISSGSFSRSFNLPETIKHDEVNADYKNGLLYVTLTKKEESKPKEIEIQVS